MQSLPIIIDIEASGFGADSYPIEIGTVDALQHRFCTLVQPAEEWIHWDEKAARVHNIQREQLFDHGISIHEAALLLNDRYSGQTLYSDGWVVDKPWLDKLFYRAGLTMTFRISAIEMILSEAQMAIWHEEKERVINSLQIDRHRASNDALIIQQTYVRTLTRVQKENQPKSA